MCHGGHFISHHQLSDGGEQWQRAFTASIHQLVSWQEQVVVVALDNKTLYALEATTGRELWQQEGSNLQVVNDSIYVASYFQNQPFIIKQIEPQTGKATRYDLSALLQQHKLFHDLRMDYTIQDRLIYISFFYQRKIAIINLDTLQLEQLCDIPTTASWINTPVVYGNRLYVLDEANTLHVYERHV